MVHALRIFGNKGEEVAAEYLQNKGYKILFKQYKSPFGEIDLVCSFGDEVIFVEVKTRRSNEFGYPEDSVTKKKIHHIERTAEHFLGEKKMLNCSWRVDVIAIEVLDTGTKVSHFESIDIIE